MIDHIPLEFGVPAALALWVVWLAPLATRWLSENHRDEEDDQ